MQVNYDAEANVKREKTEREEKEEQAREAARRVEALRAVFCLFDWDKSGFVEAKELFALGALLTPTPLQCTVNPKSITQC